MTHSHPAVHATDADIAEGVTIASTARLHADTLRIGKGAIIGDGVRLSGDRIEIGEGCRLSNGVSIVGPDITIGAATSIGEGCAAEVNERLRIGALSQIGARLRVIGQSIDFGDRLWLTDDVVIGGGGARSRRAVLAVGERVAVMDRCLVNLCREVTIGDDSALSNGVVLLTHTVWHPLLVGGAPVSAPVRLGNDVIIFVNAVVAPGVTIGDGCTVAANALVVSDVRARSLAIGNPARVIAIVPAYPRELSEARQDELIRAILGEWALELPFKGLAAEIVAPGLVSVSGIGWRETFRYLPYDGDGGARADAEVTLACRPTTAAERGGCHFDLTRARMTGAATQASEDLRDFLRRQAVRVFADRPFQPLPPANIARLKARLAPHD